MTFLVIMISEPLTNQRAPDGDMTERTKTWPLSGVAVVKGRKQTAYKTGMLLPQASCTIGIRFFVLTFAMAFFFGSAGATTVLEAPFIDPAEEYVVGEKGGNLTLTCRGKHPVHWVIDNNSSEPRGSFETDKTKELPYTATLHLVDLNYTDVSFFNCAYLVSNKEWDMNDPLVSKIYVFVKDESPDGKLLVSDLEGTPAFSVIAGRSILVPCKPTFPEVEVKIKHAFWDNYFEGEQDNFYGINFVPSENGPYVCFASYKDREKEDLFYIVYLLSRILPQPKMKVEPFWQNTDSMKYDVIEGKDVNITCEVEDYELVFLDWKLPLGHNKTGNIEAHRDVRNREGENCCHIISVLLLKNVEAEKHKGTYECVIQHRGQESNFSSVTIEVVSEEFPYMELTLKGPATINTTLEDPDAFWNIMYRAYPQPTFVFSKDDEVILSSSGGSDVIVRSHGEYEGDDHYSMEVERMNGYVYVEIKSPSLEDVGVYEFQAYHQSKNPKKFPLTLLMQSAPQDVHVELVLGAEAALIKPNETYGVKCHVKAYPQPVITLQFSKCPQPSECLEYIKLEHEPSVGDGENKLKGVHEKEWRLTSTSPGRFRCLAGNIHGAKTSSEEVLMIADGPSLEAVAIGIEKLDRGVDVVEGDNVTLKCYINKMADPANMQWYYQNSSAQGMEGFQFSNTSTVYSEVLELTLISVTQEMSGVFMCGDQMREEPRREYTLIVEAMETPTWSTQDGSTSLYDVNVNETEPLTLKCIAKGQPMPTVTWFKDGQPFKESPQTTVARNRSSISFSSVKLSDAGTYVCEVSNRIGNISAEARVKVEAILADGGKTHILMLIVVGILATIIFAACLYFTTRLIRDRRERHLIKLADQRAFEEGDPNSLNPDLGLEEQAELLPYSPKWELSKEQVIIERMLGSGAFGKVYKASVANLIPGQTRTTVAVKMMKCRGDKEQLKALRSELKIMIHIGRHINIVNLLGACSKNMATKGELLLVVEYCKYGCLLSYMQRHRRDFVNQINPATDKIDQTIISHTDLRCRQRSGSLLGRRAASRQSRIKYTALQFNADGVTYTADANGALSDSTSELGSPQATSPTLQSGTSGTSYPDSAGNRVGSPIPNKELVSCSSNLDSLGSTKNGIPPNPYRQRSGSGSSMGLMSDMTCMTIESSGASDGYVRGVPGMSTALCSKDLLCWAYQISRGMEYLSFRKVLHGDLAARNILLDENHVVKISDFGLAKDIYKNDNYFKQSEGRLPVKWLSIEAIRDRIFSTQSDVWSFGVVLWEIFSLGQNPYPGVEFDMEFLHKLEKGLRMEQPRYATYELYRMMLDCWHDDPRERPCFSQLEETLGGMIGETEKQFYLDLNHGLDSSTPEVDYLSFLRSPDYNSIVRETTPIDEGYVLAQGSCEEPQVKDISTLDCNRVASPKPLLQLKPALSLSGSFSSRSEYLQMGTPTLTNEVFDFAAQNNQQDETGEETEESDDRKRSPEESPHKNDTYLQMNSPKDKKDATHFSYPEVTSPVPKLAPMKHTLSTDSRDSGLCSPPVMTQTNPCYLRMTSNQSITQDEDTVSKKGSTSAANSCQQKTETGASLKQKPSLKPKPTVSISEANYVNYRPRTESSCSSGLGSLNEEPMEESVTFKMKAEGKDIHPIAEEVGPVEVA